MSVHLRSWKNRAMPPSGGHVVRVSQIPSSRWDLALEQIAGGGAMTVLECEPPVGLQRYEGWPGADGVVHISIFTSHEPSSLTAEIATREVAAGLRHLSKAMAADPRLGVLLDRYGVVREYVYVYDYGTGAVAVADASEDGTVTLR